MGKGKRECPTGASRSPSTDNVAFDQAFPRNSYSTQLPLSSETTTYYTCTIAGEVICTDKREAARVSGTCLAPCSGLDAAMPRLREGIQERIIPVQEGFS